MAKPKTGTKKKGAPKKKRAKGAAGATMAAKVKMMQGQILSLGGRVSKVERKVEEHDQAIGRVVTLLQQRFGSAGGATKPRKKRRSSK